MAAETRRIDTSCERAQISDAEFSFKWWLDYDWVKRTIGSPLESPIFSTGYNNEHRWCMKIYRNAPYEDNKGDVSLIVCFLPSGKHTKLRAKFQLSILIEAFGEIQLEEKTHTFIPGTPDESSGLNTFMKWPLMDSDTIYLDTLIICVIKYELEIFDTKMPEYRFLDNQRTLFESKELSDVTLIVGERAFRAHKVFLAMHSPVFSAMFEHEMTERTCNEVKITDVAPDVLDEMLRYMYTGEVTDIEKIAKFLLVAADKYAVKGLKDMCAEVLRKNIAVENAVDTLILADKHSIDRLKTSVLKFIASSTMKVMATPEFLPMVQSHPHLVAEALRELAVTGGQKPE